jgi:putative flippase GtrA
MRQTYTNAWQSASQWQRWLAFNLVGLLGIAVQLGILASLTLGLSWNYLVSTFLAVEITILHNFFWHERWTWVDKTNRSVAGRLSRLLRFHAANGAVSLLGNLVLMWLFVGILHWQPVIANICSITICSLVNFFASDRWVFRERGSDSMTSPKQNPSEKNGERESGTLPQIQRSGVAHKGRKHSGRIPSLLRQVPILVLGFWVIQGMPLEASQLRPETISAWNRYAEATEQRIEKELRSKQGFLALDYQAAAMSSAEKRAIAAGGVQVTKMQTCDGSGEAIQIPYGMIHHWRGSVFIPGVDINFVLARIANPSLEDTRQEDVLDSRVLGRGPDSLTLFLKLRRVKFVTVVYNTEHAVRFGWHGRAQAYSRSVATRIAEVDYVDSPQEREKPIGQDRGFLWRLNSYWRYQQAPGGVIVECESISLSRTVPGFLVILIRPLIDSTARESMGRTLESMRERMVRAVHANGSPAPIIPLK